MKKEKLALHRIYKATKEEKEYRCQKYKTNWQLLWKHQNGIITVPYCKNTKPMWKQLGILLTINNKCKRIKL